MSYFNPLAASSLMQSYGASSYGSSAYGTGSQSSQQTTVTQFLPVTQMVPVTQQVPVTRYVPVTQTINLPQPQPQPQPPITIFQSTQIFMGGAPQSGNGASQSTGAAYSNGYGAAVSGATYPGGYGTMSSGAAFPGGYGASYPFMTPQSGSGADLSAMAYAGTYPLIGSAAGYAAQSGMQAGDLQGRMPSLIQQALNQPLQQQSIYGNTAYIQQAMAQAQANSIAGLPSGPAASPYNALYNPLASAPLFSSADAGGQQNSVNALSVYMMQSMLHAMGLMYQMLALSSSRDAGTVPAQTGYGYGPGGYTNGDTGSYTQPPVGNYGTYIPPQPPEQKVLGSAGLFGDPQFGIFTPGLNNVPNALKAFESGLKPGQTVTLLNDHDLGGLNVTATGVQVNPANADSTGVGHINIQSDSDKVLIKGNGELWINGLKKGNLKDNGLIAPIKLANGLTISSSQEIDGPNGQRAERFVISNGEYKITAAPRSPHPDANPYLDMNFEELTANAAENATGFQATVPGLVNKFGIPDLLRFEPVGLSLSA